MVIGVHEHHLCTCSVRMPPSATVHSQNRTLNDSSWHCNPLNALNGSPPSPLSIPSSDSAGSFSSGCSSSELTSSRSSIPRSSWRQGWGLVVRITLAIDSVKPATMGSQHKVSTRAGMRLPVGVTGVRAWMSAPGSFYLEDLGDDGGPRSNVLGFRACAHNSFHCCWGSLPLAYRPPSLPGRPAQIVFAVAVNMAVAVAVVGNRRRRHCRGYTAA